MTRLIKILGWALLAASLLGIAAVACVVAMSGSAGPLDDMVIRIDDSTLTLSRLGWADGIWLTAGIAVCLLAAFVVLVIVVPLAVLLPLLAVALVAGALLLAVVSVVAVAISPLALLAAVVWLTWRLARWIATRPGTRAPPQHRSARDPDAVIGGSHDAGASGATMTR